MELDDEEYEVKVLYNGVKHEIEIHAYSGEVIDVELDDNDDEDDRGTSTPQKSRITLEEARRIALGRINGTIVEEERDDDSYDFDIRYDGRKYEVEVHAFTGAVKEIEVDDDDDDDDRGASTPQKSRITLEEARRIALGRINGTIVEEERDDDNYDFDIRYDGKKYEIEVHALTGAVKEVEVDDDDDDDDRGESTPQKSKITLDEARQIALGRVNGTISDEDSDDDSYDFEVHHQGKEYEIEINAYTGIITEFEVDDED